MCGTLDLPFLQGNHRLFITNRCENIESNLADRNEGYVYISVICLLPLTCLNMHKYIILMAMYTFISELDDWPFIQYDHNIPHRVPGFSDGEPDWG